MARTIEEQIVSLSLRRGAELTSKTRAYVAVWLRAMADEIEDGNDYAATFRASLWSGRGLGWKKGSR